MGKLEEWKTPNKTKVIVLMLLDNPSRQSTYFPASVNYIVNLTLLISL